MHLRTCLSLLLFQCLLPAAVFLLEAPMKSILQFCFGDISSSLPFLSCVIVLQQISVNQVQFYAFYFSGFVNSHQRKRRQSNKGKMMGVFMMGLISIDTEWLKGQGRRQKQFQAAPTRTHY